MKENINSSHNYKALPEIKELELLLGNFIQYWGFKKIHGRIWTHLYTSKTPLDSQTLILRLKVSKALMSLAIRDLTEYEVISPVSIGKHGVTFYQANPDLMHVVTNVLRKREAVMMSSISSCLARITSCDSHEVTLAGLDIDKCENLKNMTNSAIELLNIFIMQDYANDHVGNLNIFSKLNLEHNS